MKAFLLTDLSKLDLEVSESSDIYPDGWPADTRLFSMTSTLGVFPRHSNQVGNIFFPWLSHVFQEVVVGRSVRLFRGDWSAALLVHLNDLLVDGGQIIIPLLSDKEAKSKGFLSLGDLQTVFKQKGRILQSNPIFGKRRWVKFQHIDSLVQPASVLSWHYQTYSKLLTQEFLSAGSLIEEKGVPVYAPTINGAAFSGGEPEENASAKFDAENLTTALEATGAPVDLKRQLEMVVGSQSYSISGVAYKSALISHIIKERFRSGQKIKYLDQGGGYGLLTVELLLNQDLNITKGVTCDINPKNEARAFQLFSDFRHQLESRFFFKTVAAQDYEYNESFDVISYVGSLLYVPKDQTQMVLERAWSALNSGGILVIHENIKQASYVRNYDVMFTTQEIDELLSRFAHVDRYLSTTTTRVSKDAGGNKSLFRVIQKK